MSATTANGVMDTVRRFVAEYNNTCAEGRKLEVPEHEPRHDGDWYYVIVEPASADVRAYDYYDILAQLEAKIEEQEGTNVLLVPVMPG